MHRRVAYTHAHTHAQTCAIHTYTHSCTDMHMHTHMHTYTHTCLSAASWVQQLYLLLPPTPQLPSLSSSSNWALRHVQAQPPPAASLQHLSDFHTCSDLPPAPPTSLQTHPAYPAYTASLWAFTPAESSRSFRWAARPPCGTLPDWRVRVFLSLPCCPEHLDLQFHGFLHSLLSRHQVKVLLPFLSS